MFGMQYIQASLRSAVQCCSILLCKLVVSLVADLVFDHLIGSHQDCTFMCFYNRFWTAVRSLAQRHKQYQSVATQIILVCRINSLLSFSL